MRAQSRDRHLVTPDAPCLVRALGSALDTLMLKEYCGTWLWRAWSVLPWGQGKSGPDWTSGFQESVTPKLWWP
jgi:hypothetical protein